MLERLSIQADVYRLHHLFESIFVSADGADRADRVDSESDDASDESPTTVDLTPSLVVHLESQHIFPALQTIRFSNLPISSESRMIRRETVQDVFRKFLVLLDTRRGAFPALRVLQLEADRTAYNCMPDPEVFIMKCLDLFEEAFMESSLRNEIQLIVVR